MIKGIGHVHAQPLRSRLLTGTSSSLLISPHLELTFVSEKPPPPHAFEQVALMAAEESGGCE